jgi:polyisoprenoid-binding protein YceI
MIFTPQTPYLNTNKMKKTIPAITLLAVTFAASAFTLISSFNWKVKEDSYTVSVKGKKIEGTFEGLKATIILDDNNPENSKISATIDASSISTGNWLKNRHAKSALDADQYPKIKFESTSITSKGTSYEASGNLTLKDVTKKIVLPFTVTRNGQEAIFLGKFSIVPKEYNIKRMGTPELVEITLKVPATK